MARRDIRLELASRFQELDASLDEFLDSPDDLRAKYLARSVTRVNGFIEEVKLQALKAAQKAAERPCRVIPIKGNRYE